MRAAWMIVLSITALASSACWLGDIPLEGKACPCVSPWVCDPARSVCVKPDELGRDSGLLPDAAVEDAAPFEDAAIDAGTESPDASDDAGSVDAEPGDASPLDAEPTDAMPMDAAPMDALPMDAMPMDAAPMDALPRDAMPTDALPPDTGLPDSGLLDTGVVTPDSGVDAGPPDSGATNLPLGASCSADAECTSRQCLSVTVGTSTSRLCATGCSSTSDCPTSFSCLNVSWTPYCLPETLFTPQPDYSTPSGDMCVLANVTCQSGVCDSVNLMCQERCWSESDCASFGGQCATFSPDFRHVCATRGATATGGACSTDADCASGICDRMPGTCAAHCCSATDCPNGQSCLTYLIAGSAVTKICTPRRTSGTLGFGAACTNNTQCVSEICGWLSTTGTGPRVCSSACCEDADCAFLPGGGRCWPFPSGIGSAVIGMCIPP